MINVINQAKESLEKLNFEIKNLTISNENAKKVDDLYNSVLASLKEVELLADEYEHYKVYLLPEDVNLPKILDNPSCIIGSGAFGKVLKSKLRGSKVAVKVSKTNAQDDPNAEQEFRNEIRILRSLQHDNIVAYRGSGFFENNRHQFVVMEFIEDTLHTFIHPQPAGDRSGLSAFLTWHIMLQIGNALSYLHSFKLTHGDIKPNNILLDLTPVYPRPKLCDFGFTWKDYNEQKGHIRYSAPIEAVDFESAKRKDMFSFGLVLLETRTGKRPWGNINTHYLSSRGDLNEVVAPTSSKKSWKVGDITVSEDVISGKLGEIIKDCCILSRKKTFDEIMKKHFAIENPFKAKETKGEFFSCGFLTNTNIFVLDSMVLEEGERAVGSLPTYQKENLICDVELEPETEFIPEEEVLNEQYLENHRKYLEMAKNKDIDNNKIIALKHIGTDRAGDDESQKITLSFVLSSYCHHRAMRDIWLKFDEMEKNQKLQDKQQVHKLFSTSFGLHVAILTNEGDLEEIDDQTGKLKKKKKFVFTQRSRRKGVATPGKYTCGAVESCSINDFVEDEGTSEEIGRVSLIKTAARGLHEELGLDLSEKDREAIHLNTIYLKFDTHEWGMCGFIDLTDDRISEENQMSFQRLQDAFTGGPKDKFEYSSIYGVDFELKPMVEWIRINHYNMASSGKIAVFKVLQAYFGTAAVTKQFEAATIGLV